MKRILSPIAIGKTSCVCTDQCTAVTFSDVKKNLNKKDKFFLQNLTLTKRVNNLKDGEHGYYEMEQKLASDPEYQLPKPQAFMTAKSYKAKLAEPLIKKLKKTVILMKQVIRF